LGTLTAA